MLNLKKLKVGQHGRAILDIMTWKIYASGHFTLFKDIEVRLGKIGLGMWDIAAFDNGTIGGSGYDYNISFTQEEGFF